MYEEIPNEDVLDVKMKMYEAQAIAIEKENEMNRMRKQMQGEIDKMRGEKEQLEKKVQQFEQQAQGPSTATGNADGMDSPIYATFLSVVKGRNPFNRKQKGEIRRPPKKDTILLIGRGKLNNQTFFLLSNDRSEWKRVTLELPNSFEVGPSFYFNDEIYILCSGFGNQFHKLNQDMDLIKLKDMNTRFLCVSESSCLVFNGCIWIFGGDKGGKAMETVEKYIPAQDKWFSMPSMKEKRLDAAVAVFNRKIYVCGGNDGYKPLKSSECFDPKSGIWTNFVDIPTSYCGHLLSDGNGLIFIEGYSKCFYTIYPEYLNPRWIRLKPFQEIRGGFTAVSLGKEIFVIGGKSPKYEPLRSVGIFDGKKWRTGPEPPEELNDLCSVVIPQAVADRFLQKFLFRL